MSKRNYTNMVCVLDKDGKPLTPTKRFGKVRRMLKDGRAKVVKGTVLFTIQLQYETESHIVKKMGAGIDPGRTNIGLAVESEGECIALVHCTTSNKTVTRHISEKREHRKSSRYGDRRVRKRRAISNGTLMHIDENAQKFDEITDEADSKLSYLDELYVLDSKFNRYIPSINRHLNKCEKPVLCKGIKNSEARFHNRKRLEGWLTPTASHLLNTHMKLVNDLRRILPVEYISIESNVFAFMAMENPDIWSDPCAFQEGPLKGFGNVNNAIDEFQNGVCPLCGKPIEHHHHIIPKSKGGSDTMANIAGLCKSCHTKLHADKASEERLNDKLLKLKEGKYKEYAALSVINQIMPHLIRELQNTFGKENVSITYGYQTKEFRNQFHMEKTHELDAYCIAMSVYRNPDSLKNIAITEVSKVFPATIEAVQFRRHDRARIKAQRERTYYQKYFEGENKKIKYKPVAKNRHRRFEQDEKVLSLEEWYSKQIEQHGAEKARQMLSQLKVKKSIRYYNQPNKLMPGALFEYKGEVHIMSGQLSNGKYLRAYGDTKKKKTNYPVSKCKILCKNKGMVYMR